MPDSETNSQIILNMYQGENNRDASSKIRGFLFQDLIAVDELTKQQTNYICSEYIEDVFTSAENKIYIIQAKYYAISTLNMHDIIRDLYYQYLRLQLYGYSDNVIPILAKHSNRMPSKPTLLEMQGAGYINVSRDKKPMPPSNIDNWMKENVYTKTTKEDAETSCFEAYAWKDSIEDFLAALVITEYGTLQEFRRRLALELDAVDFPGCQITDAAMRQNILLGLAVQYIQEAYNEPPNGMDIFAFRRRGRIALSEYLEDHISSEKEENIGAYLRMVTSDCWDRVERFNPQMTQEQTDMLQYISDKTSDWLYNLGITPLGQLQLLNTVSMREYDFFINFSNWSVGKRLQTICEHHEAINTFLRYFWKIILDTNNDLLGKSLTPDERNRLSPANYVDKIETRYFKIIFPAETASSIIILSAPNNAYSGEDLACTFDRMKYLRPQKWYMCGKYHGKFSYDQKISEIANNDNISTVRHDPFRIECMDCVHVDAGCWQHSESYESTIFLDNCIKNTEA